MGRPYFHMAPEGAGETCVRTAKIARPRKALRFEPRVSLLCTETSIPSSKLHHDAQKPQRPARRRAETPASRSRLPRGAQKPRLQAPWRAETSTFSPVLPHPAQKPRLPALRRLATRRISDAQIENGSVRAKYATPSPSAELEAGNSARRTFQRFRFRRASDSRVGVG